MKKMKKFMSLVLALVLAMAMGITAFAQTEALNPADDDNATITINNPAKGETYSIYKLFDATVSGDKIAYQSKDEVPNVLTTFFVRDKEGNISPADIIKDDDKTKMTDGLKVALEAWAKDATAVKTAVSDGSATLTFTGLPYGYYVVTTSHVSDVAEGETTAKAAITVASTQPSASIYDKNINEPAAKKTVDKMSYSIGDTITYTGIFDTTNYIGGSDNDVSSKQVVDYVIQDTLPEYLKEAKVTKITIGTNVPSDESTSGYDNEKVFTADELAELQFKTVQVGTTSYEKAIIIPWAEVTTVDNVTSYKNLYTQGAKIVVEYEAKLTAMTNIGKADINTISIRPVVAKDDTTTEKEPWNENWEDKAEIFTYAAAIKKVDQDKNPLAGAVFKIKGLTVEAGEAGVYTVVSYDPDSETESAELSTDSNGKLYIIGLAENVKLTVIEYKAPDGYNKLTENKELTLQEVKKEIFVTAGEKYYDVDGNLVSQSVTGGTTTIVEKNNLSDLDMAALEIVNQKGTLLPSTGGIGTTIFYVVGGILVVAAGILLVTKKRMSAR